MRVCSPIEIDRHQFQVADAADRLLLLIVQRDVDRWMVDVFTRETYVASGLIDAATVQAPAAGFRRCEARVGRWSEIADA